MLERLRGHRLRSRRAADGLLVGAHRSPRSGQAVEFSEHRQYAPGDDLRGLDWKVLGRTDKYYLRQREDETTLDCQLIVDNSGSMAFRGPAAKHDKLTFAFQVAASLAFVAIENHDRVALTTVGQEVTPRVASGGGNGQLMALATAMDQVQTVGDVEPGDVDLPARIMDAVQSTRRGGLVILISDFFDPVEPLVKALRALRFAGRPVIVVQVVDPAEEDFPFGETMEFLGLEGEPTLTADARGIAQAYREQFQSHRQALRLACREAAAACWELRSDQPLGFRLPELLERSG